MVNRDIGAVKATRDLGALFVGASSTPGTISSLSATKDGSDVDLSWSLTGDADSYEVERRTDDGAWSQIGTPSIASYTDTAPGTGVHEYRVRAVLDATPGDYGTSDNVYFANLDGAKSGVDVSLTWDTISGATGYKVFRRTDGGSWSQIGTA